jgi:hypothetical protein
VYKPGRTRKACSAFARRRPGVRIPSAPLRKCTVLQVKHRTTMSAPNARARACAATVQQRGGGTRENVIVRGSQGTSESSWSAWPRPSALDPLGERTRVISDSLSQFTHRIRMSAPQPGCARASSPGIGSEEPQSRYLRFFSRAICVAGSLRPYPWSVMYTSPANRSRSLFTVGIYDTAGRGLSLWVSLEA